MSKKSKERKAGALNAVWDAAGYLLSKMGKNTSDEDLRDSKDFYDDSIEEAKEDDPDLFKDDKNK